MNPVRLAYLVSHPIQYQAPLLRQIASDPEIDLTVFFCSDIGASEYFDREFGKSLSWDVPLLEGYKYEVLPAIGSRSVVSAFRPFSYGLRSRLKSGQFDALWVYGYARIFNLVAMYSAHRLGLRVLLRDDVTEMARKRGALKTHFKQIFFRWLNSICDAFVTVGTANRAYYLDRGILSEKLFHAPHSVDNAFFREKISACSLRREDFRKELGLLPNRPIILFAGKFIQQKRIQDLISAYAALSTDGRCEPEAYLLLLGDGGMRPKLEQQVNEYQWQSIKFLGFKNQSELPAFFDLCDVFVLPSAYESWGLVVNEIMNAGKPVIISDRVGCAGDLVRDGVNGYVYSCGQIEQLTQALQKIFQDKNLKHSMGLTSLEIISGFSYKQTIAGLKHALSSELS